MIKIIIIILIIIIIAEKDTFVGKVFPRLFKFGVLVFLRVQVISY